MYQPHILRPAATHLFLSSLIFEEAQHYGSSTTTYYYYAMAVSYDKKRKSSSSGGGGSSSDYKKRQKFDNNNNDNQTPANKKRALKHERQSHRKHSTTVRSAKVIWNELRIKTNDKATNTKLCTELHDMLKGKCMEVTMQHDASRCVQGVLQFGTLEQRREVVMELCNADSNGSNEGEKKNNQNINMAELW